ncbi:glycosyltransferase family 4 protein [Natrinema halophilum]|uniref:Glycosyltransferase family 4 protein n=1 Tax=Natrinema halophilum TaxID=1699371 RepID=A0A7D5KKD0_9EURY|nr:glycosyltransferase family 1 protein [Natrinema halophilum]QLG48918.1 glycosyltransferase family 4 protein [Natrinema halophilum]
MRIFYDGVIFTRQQFGGINRIYERLATELPTVAPDSVLRTFRFPSTLDSHPFLTQSRYLIPKLGGVLRELDERIFLPRAVNKFDPDIYHTSYFRLPADINAPSVVTVYDMIHERFADELGNAEATSAMKQASVERADHVIAISKCTKDDLVKYFDIAPEKVSVIHLAADPVFEPVDDSTVSRLRAEYDLPEQFLLYVGRRGGYKNFDTLLEAYADWEYAEDVSLVCVGGGEKWSNAEAETIRQANLEESTQLITWVDDNELRSFYTAATAFVYPSRYEGFGIPPLEAMQCETPVVASNVSAIPEVVGEAGTYVDPDDPADIRRALSEVILDPEYRELLVERGLRQAKAFDWQQTTRQTYQVYENIHD